MNNLFPDLANFINGLNERLTLADLNRFLNDGNTIDTEPKPPINVLLENVLDQKFKEYLTPLQLDNSKQDSVSVKETFLVQKEHACFGVRLKMREAIPLYHLKAHFLQMHPKFQRKVHFRCGASARKSIG